MSFSPDSPIGSQDTERLNRPIDEAYGLPGETYTDPAYFRLELERIFRRTWVCAGHITDIPDKGDITAVSVGGAPIMLVHGLDGEPRAFHNICRHKGNVLVEGSRKQQRTIVCGYHCWTYRLDGRSERDAQLRRLTGKEWEGTARRRGESGFAAGPALQLARLAVRHPRRGGGRLRGACGGSDRMSGELTISRTSDWRRRRTSCSRRTGS